MLLRDIVAIPLAGGVDTKTDRKLVLPANLLELQNAEFTKGGSVRKRPGFVSVPAIDVNNNLITDALAVAPLGDGFVLLGRKYAYMLDRARNAWSRLGRYCPATHSEQAVAYSAAKQSNSDLDSTNGVVAVAWEDSRGGVRCTIYDEASGAAYVSEYILASANASKPRVVAVGSNLLIAWFNSSATSIVCRLVRTTDVAGTIGSADITLAADANAAAQWDFIGTGDTAVLAFRQDAAVADVCRVFLVNTLAVVTKAATAGAAVPSVGPVLTYDEAQGHVWVVYRDNATNDTLAFKYSGSDLALISSGTAAFGASALAIAVSVNTYGGVTIWSQLVAGGTSAAMVQVQVFDSALTSVNSVNIRHAQIASTGFWDGFNSCCILQYNGSNLTNAQNTYYLWADGEDTDYPVLLGRILPGEADNSTAWLPRVKSLGDDKFHVALGFKRQVRVNLDKNATAVSKQSAAFEHQGIQRCELDMSPQVYAAEVDGVLYTSGGFLWAIDGAGHPVEAQFQMFPDQLSGSLSAQPGGSLLANATYNYRVYYEWTNARGQRVRSLALTLIGATTANQTIRIVLQTLTHTQIRQRSNVAIVIYRSEANQNVFYYRVSSADPTVGGANGYVSNSTGVDTITWDDQLSDTNLTGREIDYMSQGETEHFAFDGPSVIAAVGNRIFCAGGGRNPDRPQFSLLRRDGRPVESNDTFIVTEFPEYGGRFTGFSYVNNTPIVFRERAIYALGGTGPTNARGSTDTYQAEAISTDVGCTEGASILATRAGVFFKSPKGIHLLDQAGGITYVGAKVERFNSQRITGAAHVPDTTQIFFLTDSGVTLAYDYFYDAWGWHTNFEGVSMAATETDLVYLRNDGQLFQRDTSVYTDAGMSYALAFRTGWFRLKDTIQGFWRVRRLQLVGEYLSSHTLYVDVYYDGLEFPEQTITWNPDDVLDLTLWGDETLWGDSEIWYGTGDGTDYNFDEKLARQKCSTVSFGFRERPGDDPGASYEITELALEVALRSGLARLPAARKI